MAQPGRPKSDHPRTRRIGCGLNDAELDQLDKLRGGVSRGEYVRRAALGDAPATIPEINRLAHADLGRALGNLATVATAMRGGAYAELAEVEKLVREVRNLLIGLKR